ncbi:interferon-induced protein 44-like isoform X1 [Pongo pygmaeus]|uniref:interferon-induced protein 44-like isoform X1 n=1 Tax=Pongo pygmaeus TaxID=9600 RepID=UPI0023E15AE6|nr:interferon-induced protein 44-like isoform X1 [Pongo pygmaeus]XP_054306038.1 interferon-induced protein 44-like isoform X1 [Pongo pygmaeus]
MEVTTRLTWNDENHLRKLLGNVSLSLLYKSSVHGGSIENMVERCSHQGCTITMTYIDDNMIVAFMLGNYINLHESSTEPNDSLWFSLQKKNDTTEIETLLLNTAPKIIDEQLVCRLSKKDIFILCRDNKIYLDKMITRNLKLRFYGYHQYLEREVFRVEGIKDNLDDTKRIMKAREHRNRLLADIRAYKPYADLVSEIRILLVGPIGSGKSSFFNSVKSIFHGHVTGQAIVGSDITSITERYRIYSVKDGKNGKSLPFMLCDTMGLVGAEGTGLCMDDIPHILKGCMADRYQFNSHKPITPEHSTFITSPSLKDRIHCVAYVLDINSIDNLSSKMLAKFKQVHKEVLNCGIAHVALLTKVDDCSEVLQDNFLNMSRSMTSQSQVMNVHKMLGIPISNILMVGNYASDLELDPIKDILILSALRQMLRAADDFLEDLPLEETGAIKRVLQPCI